MNQKNSTKKFVEGKQFLSQKSVQQLLVGNRIPKDYFVTKGKGESEITVHAGSYHLALKDAGIEMCNIITYSSILPSVASEIAKPDKLVHGAVMETIMAVADKKKGERATASITYGWLYDKETGEKYGGLVCEYHGSKTEEEANSQLMASIQELYRNGFSEKYELRDISTVSESFVPRKKYGTAIVSICFTSYLIPVVGESN